jgi:hypothetical protein
MSARVKKGLHGTLGSGSNSARGSATISESDIKLIGRDLAELELSVRNLERKLKLKIAEK